MIINDRVDRLVKILDLDGQLIGNGMIVHTIANKVSICLGYIAVGEGDRAIACIESAKKCIWRSLGRRNRQVNRVIGTLTLIAEAIKK